MLAAFFRLAARSPTRWRTLWRAAAAHIAFVAALAWLLPLSPRGGTPTVLLGQLLLVAGVVEGAILLGWRLTQLPKSQALEFLLVSLQPAAGILAAEALVGLALLGIVTLAGLPVLLLLTGARLLSPVDLLPLLLMPFTWGAVTGLVLTVWAYEPQGVRRWGERVTLGLVLLYLVVGVLAGEKLQDWLRQLPEVLGYALYVGLIGLRDYNPFGMMRYWSEQGAATAWERALGVQLGALLLLGLLLWRAAGRLQAHFHEYHYRPVLPPRQENRGRIADGPLKWWAVRRVSQFSGRINLWLAGGFGVLYALYTVAGPHWPSWMGRSVFELCDQFGGIAAVATALVVLAAVPAAFQYGLWDASAQDRCRRLELLLLTRLDARDYWGAAAAAAWRRGRGYFGVAILLWLAVAAAGQAHPAHVVNALAAGVLLWGLYFALGFRAFTSGAQANGLGILLAVGLPLAAVLLWRLHPLLGALTPPGAVYAATQWPMAAWFLGPVLIGLAALTVASRARQSCDAQLRRWYSLHHGQKVRA